ncbi:MAG: pitrilysin family protein [Bacteroidota bacterium]
MEYTLDNGLHVILHEDNTVPIVAVSVLYHVGSKNEDPDRTGFAHFFEHLLFEGSKHLERGDFDKYVEGNGGYLNANTSWDRTFYFDMLPSNQLALGLWLESERMLHAKVEQIGIETQRKVVKEERRTRVDNQPYGRIFEEICALAYTEHPYKWPVIGYMEHLDAAQEEDYVNFYNTFYVPNNAVLSIAGDINVEEAKALVEKYFADIPRGEGEIPRPNVVEPAKGKEVRGKAYDNIQLPAIIHAYNTPAQGTDDFYALEMLGMLLSGGQSSRMYKSLVDEKQMALQAGAFPLNTEDPGLMIAYTIANAGVNKKEIEAAMELEYERVKNELISEREFQKLRNQMENDFISSNTSIAGIAESLANYHIYFGDANLINTEIDRYMAVTREDIKRVANQYLQKENRITLLYLSNDEKGKDDDDNP